MNRLQKEDEFAFEKCLNDHYTKIENGHCILSQKAINSDHANDCEGDIGSRHAISKRHLKLIVDDDDCPDHFFATKEKRTFLNTGNEIVACNPHHEISSVQGNGHVKNMTNF